MENKIKLTKKEVADQIKGKLSRYYGVTPAEATSDQIYKAVVMMVKDILLEKRKSKQKENRFGFQCDACTYVPLIKGATWVKRHACTLKIE